MTKEDFYNRLGELDFFNPTFLTLPLETKLIYLILKEKERAAQKVYETAKELNSPIDYEVIYDNIDMVKINVDELGYISDRFFDDDGSINKEKINKILAPHAKISEIYSSYLILSI